MGTVVGAAEATAIPLTTRNYTNLLGLSAGANASVSNASALGRGGMEIAVNGASTAQNTYQMDGVSVDQLWQQRTSHRKSARIPTIGIPNPDTIAEFKIQTSLYDAGYGRNPGANVNVITKSGTNSMHGTAFEFFRNTDSECERLLPQPVGRIEAGLESEPVRRRAGRTDQERQAVLFSLPISRPGRRTVLRPRVTRRVSRCLPSPPAIARIPPRLPRRWARRSAPPTTPATRSSRPIRAAAERAPGMQVACDGSNINPIAMKYLQAQNAERELFHSRFGHVRIPSAASPTAFRHTTKSIREC